MYRKIIDFAARRSLSTVAVVVPAFLSKPKQTAISLYDEAVALHRKGKFNEADRIFQGAQKCLAGFFPEFELAWELSLIKNRMAYFFERMDTSSVQKHDAPIEKLLSEYEGSLLKYSGTQYDHTYGLLARERDTHFFGYSLRYFFWGLPELKKVQKTVEYDVFNGVFVAPAVQDFYTAIIEADLKKYDQNKELLAQIYQENNSYLWYFLNNLYED